jgi:cephalosporin-C deacetylase-like acetyl esterase
MNGGRAWWLTLILAMAASSAASTDDSSAFVGEALARRIVGPDLGLVEVRMFAEAKVPRMPEVRDLAAWQAQADRMRAETLRRVVYRGEAAKWRDAPTRVEWQEAIAGGPGYRIKKLRYEVVPGFWVPALLYEPEKLEGKVPAVLNFDGHDPEGMFAGYKQVRCINLAKRGMIALNVDWIGMGQLKSPENNHGLLNHLDLCGTSGVAVFYSLQTRGIDVLLAHENVHPGKVAATGLSGGGWQTIFLGSLDPRVALTAPVAGYSSFLTRSRFASDLGDSEQTPVDLATVTDYSLMTAMLAPRAALLTFNAKDNCCFAADHAPAPLLEAATPIYRLYGREAHLRTHINEDPGTHNYLKDNRQALYRMLGDEFFPGQPGYSAEEIPSDAEIKPVDQLKVALPPDQASLYSLAMALGRDLPRDPTLPVDKTAALAWQADRRERLARIVHSHDYLINAESVGSETKDGLTVNFWKLRADATWTLPAVEFARSEPRETTILLLDAGRKESRAAVEDLIAKGRRVLAIDLFDVGESKIIERGWLWNLYVSTVGERPLGLSASELSSVARWASAKSGPVSILAVGPSASITALVAAGLEPRAIGDLELRDAPATLKAPIEAKTPFEKSPSSFCFGLLESFDVPQLVALAAPRRVLIPAASPRAKAELTPLRAWYVLFGVDFQPTP